MSKYNKYIKWCLKTILMKKSLVILLGILITAVILGFVFGNISESNSTNIKTIGAILPLTGDLSTHGEESKIAAKLAVDNFNSYLQEIGELWRLEIIIEDTGTNPVIALEKLTSLNAKNIHVVIGPQSSAELRLIKGYADSNGMVLISPSSTSPSLAISDDSIFRLIPDDTKQGPALAKLLLHQNIKIIIPVWRGDTWGDGLEKSTSSSFAKQGGLVYEGIRYNPESPEFSASTSLLAKKVSDQLQKYDTADVAVVFLGFAEVLQFMQSSSEHEILNDVRWFGADGNTKEEKLITDPIGLEFSNEIQFTTTQVALNNNPVYDTVQSHIKEKLGRTPNSYAYSSYDAAYIAGLSILKTQNIDDTIKDVIPIIADDYSGAIGSTKLNVAGDLDAADYAIWGIRDGEWVQLGKYTSNDDSVSFR